MSDRLPPELERQWKDHDEFGMCDAGGSCASEQAGWAQFEDLGDQWVAICGQCVTKTYPNGEGITRFVPFPDPPVVPGETIGWRAWRVSLDWRGPRLWSLFHSVMWPTDDWLWANGAHARPEEADPWFLDQGDGWHGVCAARDRQHLSGMTRYMDPRYDRYVEAGDGGEFCMAIGECGLAGLVIPYERGFRAQRARVVSLIVPYAQWELVAPLASAYRVPVTLDDILEIGGNRG